MVFPWITFLNYQTRLSIPITSGDEDKVVRFAQKGRKGLLQAFSKLPDSREYAWNGSLDADTWSEKLDVKLHWIKIDDKVPFNTETFCGYEDVTAESSVSDILASTLCSRGDIEFRALEIFLNDSEKVTQLASVNWLMTLSPEQVYSQLGQSCPGHRYGIF